MATGVDIPKLPAAQVRAAIEAHDWSLATALLGEHQRLLTQAPPAAVAVALSPTPRERWLDLLVAQRALLLEVRIARDLLGASLARLNQDHRDARTWLRELA